MAGQTEPYDIQTYLLDRANIHDTVSKLTFMYDTKSPEGLIKEVFAPSLVVDYTRLMGGDPVTTTREEWAPRVMELLSGFDSNQHVNIGTIARLPQPTKGAVRPRKCAADVNVQAHLVRRAARGGPMMHNGGRVEYELERLDDLEEAGENPWRITKQVVIPAWEDGNSAVYTSEKK